jgi:Raf kinase inhibitor-like YbhB/YbcL family protein
MTRFLPVLAHSVLLVVAPFAVGAATNVAKGAAMPITVTSQAFQNMQPIPPKYTCDGQDISPPIAWKDVPPETKSIVLICDDPDAPVGTWTHWVCYGIPATVDSLPEDVPKKDSLPVGGCQGINSWLKLGYGGPCPPSGPHRYFFKVLALDVAMNLPSGKNRKDIEKAMRGHVIGQGELIGTYQRR